MDSDPNEHKDKIYQNDDGKYYQSVKNKSGKYIWKKLNIKMKKNFFDWNAQFPNYVEPKYPVDFIYDSVDKLVTQLKKIGIQVFYFDWSTWASKSYGFAGIDDIKLRYIDENLDPNSNGYIFFTDAGIYNSAYDGVFRIHHVLKENIIPVFNKFIKDIYPKKTLGFQNRSDTINVFTNNAKLVKTKPHTNYLLALIYNGKNKVSANEAIEIGEDILKQLGKQIAESLYDVHSSKNKIVLFYEIYNDKYKKFIELVPKLKLPSGIKFTKIIVEEGMETKVNPVIFDL